MNPNRHKYLYRWIAAGLFLLAGSVFLLSLWFKTPSNDRVWSPDQELPAYAEFNGDEVTIRNIRNARYRTSADFDVAHYDRTVRISELTSLDYMVEELDGFPGFAHTLLSFGFADSTWIAISVEIRKEAGETYSPLRGLLREFELMYVIADERDVIGLRANYRENPVYLYPVEIGQESLQKLFVSMLERANELRERPEFYNTFTSTCTTNLARAASETTEQRFWRYHPQILLPGFSDRLLLRRGLIETELADIGEVRSAFAVNELAEKYRDSEEFSLGIRQNR
jgi:hypothetical protein